MEPKEKYGVEKNTITLAMDAEQIRKIIDEDLDSVIFAKGVSNHMGSAVTENEKVTSMVLAEVGKHKLYFFDSFVTFKSVCQKVAKKIKLRFARRDIFIDNQNAPGYIKGQLIKLKNLSAKKGIAIGIGHDRTATLMVLKEMLPQLEKQGYKFVFISDVAR